MFKHAPSDVFLQQSPPLDPPMDFYMESEPVVSASEEIASVEDVSVKLIDFGVGKSPAPRLPIYFQSFQYTNSE